MSKLHSTLHPYFQTQLKNLHKSLLRQYRVSIENAIKQEGYDFAQVVRQAKDDAEKEFKLESDKIELEESGWSREEQETLFKEDLESVAELLRKEETRKMIAIIEASLNSSFRILRPLAR